MLSDATICAYLPASDVPRARKFYEEIVGLKPNSLWIKWPFSTTADTAV